jgi:uncharacterized membrane protein YphA (DoxX/SURF4 family)
MFVVLTSLSPSKRVALLRIVFGVVWLVDTALKFQPSFYHGLLTSIVTKDIGEPSWLNPWFHTWYKIIGLNPDLFAIIIIIIEVLFTLSLILGIGRRVIYLIGASFMFLVWGIGEAFGGPYVAGTTDINAGFIYVLVFLLLYVCEGLVAPVWSLDNYIAKHFRWWTRIANPPTNTIIKQTGTKDEPTVKTNSRKNNR